MQYDAGGKPINRDQAYSIALAPPRDLVIAGIAHPLPAKWPHLGNVQWRIARYTLP